MERGKLRRDFFLCENNRRFHQTGSHQQQPNKTKKTEPSCWFSKAAGMDTTAALFYATSRRKVQCVSGKIQKNKFRKTCKKVGIVQERRKADQHFSLKFRKYPGCQLSFQISYLYFIYFQTENGYTRLRPREILEIRKQADGGNLDRSVGLKLSNKFGILQAAARRSFSTSKNFSIGSDMFHRFFGMCAPLNTVRRRNACCVQKSSFAL